MGGGTLGAELDGSLQIGDGFLVVEPSVVGSAEVGVDAGVLRIGLDSLFQGSDRLLAQPAARRARPSAWRAMGLLGSLRVASSR